MSSAGDTRPYRNWVECLTKLALQETLTADMLAERYRQLHDAETEAFLTASRTAAAACIAAGLRPDDNGQFLSPNPLLVPPNLPEAITRAYECLRERDQVIAVGKRLKQEFVDDIEAATSRMILAARSGRLKVLGKADGSAISTKIEPHEFEYLGWSLSIGEDHLLNYEQNCFWRQVTVEREGFERWLNIEPDEDAEPAEPRPFTIPTAADRAIRSAFEQRVLTWPADIKPPSEERDLKWLRETLGRGVSRDVFRPIRRELAPGWCKRGRR